MLILITSVASNSTYAGDLLTDPVAKNFPASKIEVRPMVTAVAGTGNSTPIARGARAIQKLSCWQNGELILEQAVIAPRNKVTDIRLLHNPEKGTEMLAFDFRNAFCFIK